jgi:Flp pilus assembly protein TadD
MYHGQQKEAAVWFRKAVHLSPRTALYRYQLGTAYELLGQADAATEMFQIARQLDPAWPSQAARTARKKLLQEKRTEAAVKEGLFLARQACWSTLNRVPEFLDTLAIAEAADHRFKDAMASAREAIRLAREQGNEELSDRIRERLHLYEKRKPYARYQATREAEKP